MLTADLSCEVFSSFLGGKWVRAKVEEPRGGELARLCRGDTPWIMLPRAHLAPLKAAQLRLALGALYHARLARHSPVAVRVRDADVVEMVGRLLLAGRRLTFSRAQQGLIMLNRGAHVRHPGWSCNRAIFRSSAIAADSPMTSGRHAVQFTLERYQGGRMVLGVVDPSFDPSSGWATATEKGWGYSARTGFLSHSGKRLEWATGQRQPLAEGDVLGLVLDLDAGSLTACRNGVRLGELVNCGLSGPMCWAADLCDGGDAVRMLPVAAQSIDEHNAALIPRLQLLRDERRERNAERARQQSIGEADRAMVSPALPAQSIYTRSHLVVATAQRSCTGTRHTHPHRRAAARGDEQGSMSLARDGDLHRLEPLPRGAERPSRPLRRARWHGLGPCQAQAEANQVEGGLTRMGL